MISIHAALLCAAIGSGVEASHRCEWRASTFTVSSQSEADLAVDPEGRILVAWSSRRQQQGRCGVYAQWFDASGAAIGEETALNLWAESHQQAPCVAIGGGTAWAAWQSHGQDGWGGAIIARRLGGSEVLVNKQARGHQADPVIAADDDGAMVAWTSDGEVRARPLDPTGPELVVARAARTPSIAAGNGYAIAYASAGSICVRRYDPLTGLGDPIEVSDGGTPIEPVITGIADGWVVAWIEPAAGTYAVIARRLDDGGCPAGDSFFVAPHAPVPQTGAALTGTAGGGFAVAFNAPDGDGRGIFIRRFAADGRADRDASPLTLRTEGDQALRQAAGTARLAATPGGGLVCAWSGDGGFGDASSVNVTMLAGDSLPAMTRGVTDGMRPAGQALLAAAGPRPHEPPTFDPQVPEQEPRTVVSVAGGAGFDGILNTGWTPPDPSMAVGPDHLVLMTNGAIAFFTKEGVPTFQDEIEGAGGFWGSVGATGFVFDPEVLYDPMSGRFFAMASEAFAPGNNSYVLVAVSDDADPNGTWHKYRFQTTALAGDTFDSPNIGVDNLAVYITGDGVGNTPTYAIYIFDKASLLAGAPPLVSNSLTLPSTTLSAGIPPVSFDDPPALYMIEHREFSFNSTVRLIALQAPLSSPTLTTMNLTVPSYGPPEDPPQAGTTVDPETFDSRFWSVAYRNGSLWATHHINSDRVLARWYEIAMNGWPDSGMQPTLVQSGEIDPGAGVRTFFSSITVDPHGNASMTFARSSPSEFISMATAFRYASDPLGTFRDPVTQAVNTGPYTNNRWGDYCATNIDPVDTVTVWAHHEYAIGNSWRTWVSGTTPVFNPADQNFDGVVGIADFLIVLGNWGDCPDPCPPACLGDVDGDCEVGILDFLAVLGNWS